MKFLFRGGDPLIDQTLALVRSVDRQVTPQGTEAPKANPPKQTTTAIADEANSTVGSERAEIAKYIANFRAHQERFRVERDQYWNSVMKRTRGSLEQHRID